MEGTYLIKQERTRWVTIRYWWVCKIIKTRHELGTAREFRCDDHMIHHYPCVLGVDNYQTVLVPNCRLQQIRVMKSTVSHIHIVDGDFAIWIPSDSQYIVFCTLDLWHLAEYSIFNDKFVDISIREYVVERYTNPRHKCRHYSHGIKGAVLNHD